MLFQFTGQVQTNEKYRKSQDRSHYSLTTLNWPISTHLHTSWRNRSNQFGSNSKRQRICCRHGEILQLLINSDHLILSRAKMAPQLKLPWKAKMAPQCIMYSFVQNGPSVYSSCVQNGPSVHLACVRGSVSRGAILFLDNISLSDFMLPDILNRSLDF